MRFLKEYFIKNKTLAKLKIMLQVFLSKEYIVITINNDKRKDNVKIDLQSYVINSELKFYNYYLTEFVTNTSSIVSDARKIISSK